MTSILKFQKQNPVTNQLGDLCWLNEADDLHREDGPALIYKETDDSYNREDWFLNGERHNDSGPAIKTYRRSHSSGEIYRRKYRWFLNGKSIDHVKVEEWYIGNGLGLEKPLHPKYKMLFKLTFG